jgi:replicative DNA helicase
LDLELNLGNLEYLILNYSLKDRSFWLKVFENIKPKYFEKSYNKEVFKLFRDYFQEYNELPELDVAKNELRDIEEDLIDGIYNQKTPHDESSTREYVYNNTLRFIRHKMMSDKLSKSVELMEEGRFDEIGEEIKEVLIFNMDTSLGVKLEDIDERYRRINELMTEKVPTGFPQMDAVLHGGWAKKELYSVAAPPGVGKSIFLANWAINALKQNLNVLVYTLEISEERLSQRHDAILTKIPMDELALDIERLKKKYSMVAKTIKTNLWVKEFPTKTVTVNHLKSHAEQLMLYENFVPDVILIDYAGLMKPTYRTGDGYEDLKTIYEDLRGWAGEANVPIVTAAQTNRKSLDEKGGTKEIITQAQVSESLGITQTLDLFMTISQSRQEKEEGIINLYFDKHRHGESSKMLKFDINYKNFLLEELEV